MSLLFSGSARVALHDSQFEIILIYITGYSTSLMSSAPFIFSQLSTLAAPHKQQFWTAGLLKQMFPVGWDHIC